MVEREVPEVVRPDLQLEPVLGAPQRRGHHPRIVDEDRNLAEVLAEGPNRAQIGEVQPPYLGVAGHLCGGLVPLAGVAARQNHVAAALGKRTRDRRAEPAVGPGDDDRASLLVGDLGSRPPRHGDHAIRCGVLHPDPRPTWRNLS